MDNPDTVERVARAIFTVQNEAPPMQGDPVEDYFPEARAAIAALTTPADGLAEELEALVEKVRKTDRFSAWLSPRTEDIGKFVIENADAILTALRAAQPTERARVDYRGIALAAIKRARQGGESQEMLARWISEDIHTAEHLTPTDTPVVAHETASGDTQAGLCSTDDRQADTPATTSRDALCEVCGCTFSAGDIPCQPEHGACPLAEPSGQHPMDWDDYDAAHDFLDRRRSKATPPSGQSDAVGELIEQVRGKIGRMAQDFRDYGYGRGQVNARETLALFDELTAFLPPHQETDNGR